VRVPFVYDTGGLVAVDRDDRWFLAVHQIACADGRRVIVPAVVAGQAWRDGRRQANLGRFLRTCEIEPTRLEAAKAAGVLCGQSETTDLVDALVVVCALTHGAVLFTSDPDDMSNLAAAATTGPGLVIRRV
jgi:hypothetical protein